MKWFTSEPPANIPILCRFNDKSSLGFYVCVKDSWEPKYPGKSRLVEAGGEEYAGGPIDELVAWTTFEELEKDFKRKN